MFRKEDRPFTKSNKIETRTKPQKKGSDVIQNLRKPDGFMCTEFDKMYTNETTSTNPE